jgi:Xaa-Pro aminopeptidase
MVADPRFFARPGRVDDPHSSLSIAERDRRWGALRARMSAAGVDCLLIWGKGRGLGGNCRWIDNADFGERCLVFPLKGNPVTMWTISSWSRWFRESCWEGVEYIGAEGKDSVAAAGVIAEYGYSAGTVGVVGLTGAGMGAEGAMPYFTWRNLQALLPEARFCEAGALLRELRMYKSDEELQLVGKASEIANIEIDAALRATRPGVRESELYALMEAAGLAAGADPVRDYFTILSSGKGYPTNRRQTDRLMRSGDMVQFGIYTRYGGYWAHPHMAISMGPIDPEYVPMREAVLESTHAIIAALKPGTPWSEVERIADEPILRRGYYHEITHVHSLGLDGTEPPVAVMSAGTLPKEAGWRRPPVIGSVRENDEWKAFAATDPFAQRAVTVEPGMVLALEVKATLQDRIFLEFGPQVVVTGDGVEIHNPDAMDVIQL